MITKSDISNFFNLEAEAAKKSWEATMKLPLKDRIRKRKAIQNVFLDKGYRDMSSENHILLKVTVTANLADFKEGEGLILHKEENDAIGFECTLYEFEGEDTIILDVFPPKMPSNLEEYYDRPLFLDKAHLDLRPWVYDPFVCSLPLLDEDFWNTLLINSIPSPTIEDIDKCKDELDETIDTFELKLLPNQREAVLNSMSAKDYYLIQGPPGTGKSFVLSLIIFEEIAYFHHKVIVIGPNHMAINNTLIQVLKQFPGYSSFLLKVGQLYHAPKLKVEFQGMDCQIFNALFIMQNYIPEFNMAEEGWVVGLTPHSLYSSRARGLKCDTLIIDEAGQMTIPLALMGMVKANKVILAGDHKQLPPIITSEEMPDYMKKSAFEALMKDDNYTLLDTSFRMCEPLCEFVSDVFYDGKVKPYKQGFRDLVICNDPLYSFDKPIIIHNIDDDGMQASDKEADYIVNTIVEFLKKGVPSNEIAVLAPFRAQAAAVRRGIRRNEEMSDEDKKNLVADTVDKMQGQEREVIIYSFTAGDSDYITEMADFLYKPNKLNVAFSRAKSKLIIVGNFDIIQKTIGENFPHIKNMLEHKNVTVV